MEMPEEEQVKVAASHWAPGDSYLSRGRVAWLTNGLRHAVPLEDPSLQKWIMGLTPWEWLMAALPLEILLPPPPGHLIA